MFEAVRAQFGAARAILQRDFSIFVSYRLRTFGIILGSVFSVTSFYYVSRLVRVDGFLTPADYFAFVVVGIIIVQVLQSTLMVPLQLRSELVAGTFERIIMSPFGVVGGVVSMMIFPFLNTVVVGLVTLVFSVVVFSMPIEADTAPLALPVAFLGALSFASIGVLFAGLTLIFKQATGITWVVALISLVGGLYFPIALLPEWIQWTSEVQPFTPTVDLLRHLVSGQPLTSPAAESLLKLLGFVFVLLPIAMVWLARAASISRRRGTIIEY